jgi:hypothetical protein
VHKSTIRSKTSKQMISAWLIHEVGWNTKLEPDGFPLVSELTDSPQNNVHRSSISFPFLLTFQLLLWLTMQENNALCYKKNHQLIKSLKPPNNIYLSIISDFLMKKKNKHFPHTPHNDKYHHSQRTKD